MGLRINTNLPALIALQNLQATDARQIKTIERLSTGLRINHAGDDPTGLVLSESFRAQSRALKQATENSKTADSLLMTADAAVGQITTFLIDIKKALVAGMAATVTPAEKAAQQSAIDRGLQAISTAVASSKFGSAFLLNGQSGFTINNLATAAIRAIQPAEVRFNPVVDPTTFTVNLTTPAAQATTTIASGVVGGPATLVVTGPRGSVELNLASGATASDVATAINANRGYTGIFATGTTLFTEDYGSAARIRLQNVAGTGTVAGIAPGGNLNFAGTDAVGTFGGTAFTATGNSLAINTPSFRGTVEMQPGAVAGSYSFTVARSGLLFQVGADPTIPNQITAGIPSLDPGSLGLSAVTIGGQVFEGFLSSLVSGGANSIAGDAQNGLRIVNRAIDQLNTIRFSLGAVASNVVEPAQAANEVAIENLNASDSTVRDADMAAEIAAQSRNQVLFEAITAVLAQANALPQTVLELLR